MDRRSCWLALFALTACTPDPTPSPTTSSSATPGPTLYRGHLAVVLDAQGTLAVTTTTEGEYAWKNLAECLYKRELCIGVDDGLAFQPEVEPLRRSVADRVGDLVPGQPTRHPDACTVFESAFDEDRPTGPTMPATLLGAPTELPVPTPLELLDVSVADGLLSVRWVPAGEPMELLIRTTVGRGSPLLLPIDDTGTLDLPLADLDPDTLAAEVVLSRVYYGTFLEGTNPVDWSVRAPARREVQLGGDRERLPEATCTDATPLLGPGRYWLPQDSATVLRFVPTPDDRLLQVRSSGRLSRDPACGSDAQMAHVVPDAWEQTLTILPGAAAVVHAHTDADEPAWIDVAWIPREDPEQPPVCDDAALPLVDDRVVLDRSSLVDEDLDTCTSPIGSLQRPYNVSFPVSVPADGVMMVFAPDATHTSWRETCAATSCIAGQTGGATVWRNDTGAVADLQVGLEIPPSPVPAAIDWYAGPVVERQSAVGCDGPLIERGGPAVRVLPAASRPAGWCSNQPPQSFGRYTLDLEDGETVRIDVSGSGAWASLLEDCDASFSGVAGTRTADQDRSQSLVYTHDGPAQTYTLEVQGVDCILLVR
jgi:hypothetical protein